MGIRLKKSFAEFIGTLFYLLIGCGTVMAVKTDYKSGCGYLVVALAFGFAYIASYCAFHKISGGHFNPALSFAAFLTKQISFFDFLAYFIAQLLASFVSCGLLFAIFYGHTGSFGANVCYDDNPWITLLIEFLLTLIFITSALAAINKNSEHSGISIGITISAVHMLGIQLTLTSINPARSIANAIFAGGEYLTDLWVFVAGPFLGAVFAALIFILFNKEKKTTIKNENIDKPSDAQISSDDEKVCKAFVASDASIVNSSE